MGSDLTDVSGTAQNGSAPAHRPRAGDRRATRPRLSLQIALASLALATTTAYATELYWDGGGGDTDWSNALNWTSDKEPDGTDDANIGSFYQTPAIVEIAPSNDEVCRILRLGLLPGDVGILNMGGGLSAETAIVGDRGTGRIDQSGGSLIVNVLQVGTGLGGEGTHVLRSGADVRATDVLISANSRETFELRGGVLQADQIQVEDGAICRLVQYGVDIGGPVIRDKLWCYGAWGIEGARLSSAGDPADMFVAPTGRVEGYGVFDLGGELDSSGRVTADGDGSGQTLDLSGFNGMANLTDNQVGQRNGWYAVNGGRLKLLPLVVPVDGTYNWGEAPDDPQIDLVNSMSITFNGVTAGGQVDISLLAPNHTDLPPGTAGIILGVWSVEPAVGLSFESADITIRYDDIMAGYLGLLAGFGEADLDVFEAVHTQQWSEVTTGVDTTNKLIHADGVGSSFFAVGWGIHTESSQIPEPGTVTLLALGALAVLRRRRR
ncbi:MAG TPA: PEP-CTERM sorting domain-containing protein [Planctomycetota bacterium]|nr:PEP-CTERM sorting domain-containing protein [Planctomycetota bacterium]